MIPRQLIWIAFVVFALPLMLAGTEFQDRAPAQNMPQDEEGLFKYANERYSNYQQWAQAAV